MQSFIQLTKNKVFKNNNIAMNVFMKKLFFGLLLICNITTLLAQSEGKYQIKFLEVNQEDSDFAVAMLENNKLVFSTSGKSSASGEKNSNEKRNLFIGDIDLNGEIQNIKPVSKEINSKYNTSGLAFSADQKTVYFSRYKKSKNSSKQKQNRIELFRAKVDSAGNWSEIEEITFGDDKYTYGYPTLNKENNKLFFVSDMLPSSGGTDIFVVDLLEDGSFGKPKNLGKTINTEGMETTPYINSNNVLFFASDKKGGKGGLDIYAAEVFNNEASEAYHLEEPINSINDDFAYIINEETSTGFFSSNRLQGNQNVDLYSFTLKKDQRTENCFITVEGRIKDKETQALLKGANVELYDLKNELIQSISTENDGFYSFKVPCSQEYNLVGNSANYKEEKQRLEILENNYHKTLHSNLNMTRLEKNRIDESKDLSKILNMAPIYFDFDKVTIRTDAKSELDKIVKIMMENPAIIVEANAHTDSWGPASYNKLLSQRRAQATVDYIVSKGIDPSRITGKGYGEERLLNNCEDPAKCSRSENQLNRRTEFVIANSGASIKLKINKETAAEKGTSLANRETEKRTVPKEQVHIQAVKNPYNNKLETNKPVTASIEALKLNKETKKELPVAIENKEIKGEPVVAAIVKEENIKAEERELTKNQEAPAKQSSVKPVAKTEVPKEATKVDVVKEGTKAEVAASAPKPEKKTAITQGTVAHTAPAPTATLLEPVKETTINKSVPAKKVTVTSASAEPNKTNNKADIYINSQKHKVIADLTALEAKYEADILSNPSIASALTREKLKVAELKEEVSGNEGVGYSNIISYNNEIISFNKTHQRLLENVNKKSPVVNDNIIVLSESTNRNAVEEKAKSTVNAYMEEQKALTIVQLEEIEKKFRHIKNMKPKYTDQCVVQINKISSYKEAVKNNANPEWANIIEYKKTVKEFDSVHKQLLNEANGNKGLSSGKNSDSEQDKATLVTN